MKKPEIEIIACHGWGLSPSFWSPFQGELPENVRFSALNRGYFGKEEQTGFSGKSVQKVVMTHSFGLFWCPGELIDRADHLVIISGFLHFHPVEQVEEKRSRLLVQQMMARFVKAPEEVFRDFYDNMFFPETPAMTPPDSLNHDLLLDDLSRIQHDRFPIDSIRSIGNVTIFHGEQDGIVSNEKGRAMHHLLGGRSRYYEIKQGGHALAYTQPRLIMDFLNPLLNK